MLRSDLLSAVGSPGDISLLGVLQLDISADRFVRTTQPVHKQLVTSLLQRVHDRGDIYKASYEGHYCVGCEKYMDEGEMAPGHICPAHRTECKLRKEENYFFKLSKCG